MSIKPWLRFYPKGLAPDLQSARESIWQAFEASARRNSQRPALTFDGQTLSFQELLAEAEKLADGLEEKLGKERRILLYGKNSANFVIAFLAATKIAIVSTPSLALSDEEMAAQIEDFAPTLILSEIPRQQAEHLTLRSLALPYWQIAGEFSQAPAAAPAPPSLASGAENLAVIQYTSGTTGNAKGAMMTHANLVTNARQNSSWFGWKEEDVNVWFLPLCHTWGICCGMLSTLFCGAHLVVHRPEKLEAVALGALYRRFGGTILYASATYLYRLLDDPFIIKQDFSSLRHVKAGAMLTQGDLKARWDESFPHAPLQQGYGLTEASPETHNNPPQRFKAGTVGVPIAGTDCRIVDREDASRILEPNQEGEVLISGPQVFAGYWRKPQATAEALREGWLLTGDIGRMDDDGYLTIVDRKKDLLKFRGYSITPATIERAMLKHPAIREALVVGKLDQREGEIPTLFYVAESELDPHDLRQHAEKHLAVYERPRLFFRLSEIPKNHVGKPLRRMLRDQLANGTSEDSVGR